MALHKRGPNAEAHVDEPSERFYYQTTFQNRALTDIKTSGSGRGTPKRAQVDMAFHGALNQTNVQVTASVIL